MTSSKMRPLDSCQFCFQDGKSDFVEIHRNQFDSIRKIEQAKLEFIENILNRYNIIIKRGYQGRLTFSTSDENRREIVDTLKNTGIPVHSLLDHIMQLTKIYGSTRREKLGELVFLQLPAKGSWSMMNPNTRKWEFLKVYDSKISGANVKINSILKQEHLGTKFFRVLGIKGKSSAIPIETLAAYNMMADQYDDSTAYWIEKNGGIALISMNYLKNIPSDFFETMVRLRPTENHLNGFLLFNNDDFPLVEKLLSLIRIRLIMQSDIKNIPTKSIAKNITVLYLESLEKERIALLIKILEKMGGVVETSENKIIVTGRKKKLIISFSDSSRNIMESNTIFISNEVLEEPARLEDTLKVIRNTCGLNKEFLDFLIADNWPIITPKDLDFVIHAAIDFYKIDLEKSKQIVLKNYDAIKMWYREVISGKIRVEQDASFIVGKLLKN